MNNKKRMVLDELFNQASLKKVKIGADLDCLKKLDVHKYEGGFGKHEGSLYELKVEGIGVSFGVDAQNKIEYISISLYKSPEVDFTLGDEKLGVNNWDLIKLLSYLDSLGRNYSISNKLDGIIKIIKIDSPSLEIIYSYEDSNKGEVSIISAV